MSVDITQRIESIFDGDDRVPFELERRPIHVTERLIVFDDQYDGAPGRKHGSDCKEDYFLPES
jgi:hypothetical protein